MYALFTFLSISFVQGRIRYKIYRENFQTLRFSES